MTAYRTREIEHLAYELGRGPRRLCLRHLAQIEFVLSVTEARGRYPADFIRHALTGVRASRAASEGAHPVLLRGDDLRQDLTRLAEAISEGFRLPLGAVSQPTHTVAELAQRFAVSTKSIARWRQRGLVAWKVVGPDGRLRVVFAEGGVRRFVAENTGLVQRAGSFSQLTEREQTEIVRRARALIGEGAPSVNAVTRAIASELGRARETIRLVLKRHDEARPHDPILGRVSGPQVVGGDCLSIWEAYQDGASLQRLAERFDRSVADVYGIVTEMRAHAIKSRPIAFMASPEFGTVAASEILEDPAAAEPYARAKGRMSVPPGLPAYFREVYRAPLLHAEGERSLFRQMNYLKYEADRLRQGLCPESATADELDRIEACLERAAGVREQIARANLRLVIYIARQHVGAHDDLFELVSVGNVALLRAIELFDYTRGFKFSTYASWTIRHRLARHAMEVQRQRTRYQTGCEDSLVIASATREIEEGDPALHEFVTRMSAALPARDWFVLRNRFGLSESRRPKTLAEIGEQIGVSKERVRQIQARALTQLRRDFGQDVERLLN